MAGLLPLSASVAVQCFASRVPIEPSGKTPGQISLLYSPAPGAEDLALVSVLSGAESPIPSNPAPLRASPQSKVPTVQVDPPNLSADFHNQAPEQSPAMIPARDLRDSFRLNPEELDDTRLALDSPTVPIDTQDSAQVAQSAPTVQSASDAVPVPMPAGTGSPSDTLLTGSSDLPEPPLPTSADADTGAAETTGSNAAPPLPAQEPNAAANTTSEVNQLITAPGHWVGGGSVNDATQSLLHVPSPGSMRPSDIAAANSEQATRLMLKNGAANQGPLSNMKIGSMNFTLGASLSAEFTDNVFGSTSNREADLILTPQITLQGTLPLTKLNSLNLTLGLGYVWYVSHPNLDNISVIVSPGTSLSFDGKIGPVLITLFDTPSIAEAQANQLTVRDPVDYDQFTNVAGLTAVWDANYAVFTANYSHIDNIGLSSEIDSQNGEQDQLSGNMRIKYSNAISGGLEATASSLRYTGNLQNNGVTYSAGPFLSVQLTNHISLLVDGGYQGGSYDTGATSQDDSSLGSFYASLSLTHDVNKFFQHSLTVSREAQTGSVSNFVETDSVDYSATWKAFKGTSIAADASFQNASESGGIFAQNFRYYSAGLSSGWSLSKHLTMSCYYRFILRDASSPPVAGTASLKYYENQIGVSFQDTF